MKKIKNLVSKYFYEKTSNREAYYAAGKRSTYATHLLIATPPGSVAQIGKRSSNENHFGVIVKLLDATLVFSNAR